MQIRAIRYFLGLHRFSPLFTLNIEVWCLPSTQRRWLNMLRLWKRILKLENETLTKFFFIWDYNMREVWCSQEEIFFDMLNISSFFEKLELLNTDSVCQKLRQYAENNWKVKIRSSPKLRTYSSINSN